MEGKVLFKIANNFLIEDKVTKQQIKTTIRKKTKLLEKTILVGDNVIYHPQEKVIEKIQERTNWLIRPKVANVDYVFIVYSVKQPDYNSFLLNKFLAFYESRNIKNVIIYFSKVDLLNKKEFDEFIKIKQSYLNDNYYVFDSLEKETKKNEIIKIFENNTICFAGQSGVGKSTFINFLIPEMNLKTQEISNALNRGKHTTTSSLIIPFNNSYIIDTPGFSSLELNMSKEELSTTFNDFRIYKTKCKFTNCLHNNEKDCYVKKMVESKKINATRYEDYLKMLVSLKENKRW